MPMPMPTPAQLAAMRPPVQLEGVSDLTVLTPVSRGLVPGAFDTITWADRLDRVLRVLDTLRQLSREVSILPTPYADTVGRWRIVHYFRFARVPAKAGQIERDQLLLNVTFDGVWEPYMRVIWGPLGPLLDVIFSHAETYRASHTHSFDDYMAWVRASEVRPGFFYADSGATVGDAGWLDAVEQRQRRAAHPALNDRDIAGLGLPPTGRRPFDPAVVPAPALQYLVALSARAIAAWWSLRTSFGHGDETLLRAVHALFDEFHAWVLSGAIAPGQPLWQVVKSAGCEEAMLWFSQPSRPPQRPRSPDSAVPDVADVQPGVLQPFAGDLGAVVLLAVRDRSAAQRWLAGAKGRLAGRPAIDFNLAFTHAGLQALGMPQDQLDAFPLDFRQGMERRAAAMGDVRQNHPQEWKRPPRNWDGSGLRRPAVGKALPRIDLGEVHVLLQLRTPPGVADAGHTDGRRLLPRLGRALAQLEQVSGLAVLSVQPVLRQPAGTGHFGFADGLGQPTLAAPANPPRYWSDQVAPGEIFVSHANVRGDGAWRPALQAFSDNGSYLVLRKLRQRTDRLDQVMARASAAQGLSPSQAEEARRDGLARMMGRRQDGTALSDRVGPPAAGGTLPSNDFDYQADPQGARCPLHSHVRRANPRDEGGLHRPGAMHGTPHIPRLLRRGVSYGPGVSSGRGDGSAEEERGLLFMAYNARIADQFEVVQRWLSGANSSGVHTRHDDPFLGVPPAGGGRTFRCPVGPDEVLRIDLGSELLVELEWGLYAFTPSQAGLKAITSWPRPGTASEAAPAGGGAVPAPSPLQQQTELLEASPTEVKQAFWAGVRLQPQGIQASAYGLLAGSADAVLEVFRDDGSRFSVQGYGQRMAHSIGLGYLGQDPPAHGAISGPINGAIAAIGEADGFVVAYAEATKALSEMRARQPRAAVDLLGFAERVMAAVCQHWFGVPDDRHVFGPQAYAAAKRNAAPDAARCPRDQLIAARYIFGARPSRAVEGAARQAGASVQASLGQALDAGLRAPLTDVIRQTVQACAEVAPADKDAVTSHTLAGIIQGIPPTVYGHLVKVLMQWVQTGELWQRQARWLGSTETALPARAQAELRPGLAQTMGRDPVPELLWRTAQPGSTWRAQTVPPDGVVAVSIRSAFDDLTAAGKPAAAEAMLFGRSADATQPTVHGCPGQAMAMGLIMGSIAALLDAGSLARAASPTQVMLRLD